MTVTVASCLMGTISRTMVCMMLTRGLRGHCSVSHTSVIGNWLLSIQWNIAGEWNGVGWIGEAYDFL